VRVHRYTMSKQSGRTRSRRVYAGTPVQSVYNMGKQGAAPPSRAPDAAASMVATKGIQDASALVQGLTLVPISAQLELFCPPCYPT